MMTKHSHHDRLARRVSPVLERTGADDGSSVAAASPGVSGDDWRRPSPENSGNANRISYGIRAAQAESNEIAVAHHVRYVAPATGAFLTRGARHIDPRC